MIKIRFFLILLLLSNFNKNLISMQKNNLINSYSELENLEQNPTLLALPEEIIQYIIQQLIDIEKLNNIIKNIQNANNIFELYNLNAIEFKNELIKNLKAIILTSHQLKNSAQYYINKLINVFKEKEQRFIKDIKTQYANYSKDQLNNELKNILNPNFIITRSDLEKAAKLIIAGAYINLKNNWKKTILIWITIEGYKDIAALLLNCKNIDVNVKDKDSYTSLMWASRFGHKEIVELLLNHKDTNLNIQDKYGQTALMMAVVEGHKNIIELFLNHTNININIKDYNGNTNLIWAAAKGHEEIIKLFLDHKNIAVNLKNSKGYTALMWAALKGYTDIVKLLLNHKNINVNLINKDGDTALILAEKEGYKDIVDLIKTKTNQKIIL